MKIAFTTTACCRPEILERTYHSFSANLQGVRFRDCALYLNVDPVPDVTLREEVVRTARRFFGAVFVNRPVVPNFTVAVKWCWTCPPTKYFFHLEDDWLLSVPFKIEDLIRRLDLDPQLTCVNLRAYSWPDEDTRICLSPGLFRATHARDLAGRMSPHANPEKQLRPQSKINPVGNLHLGYKGVCVPTEIILQDIGRPWLAASGWRKAIPVHFTRWTENPNYARP